MSREGARCLLGRVGRSWCGRDRSALWCLRWKGRADCVARGRPLTHPTPPDPAAFLPPSPTPSREQKSLLSDVSSLSAYLSDALAEARSSLARHEMRQAREEALAAEAELLRHAAREQARREHRQGGVPHGGPHGFPQAFPFLSPAGSFAAPAGSGRTH